MWVLALQALGILVFLGGTLWLAAGIRREGSAANAGKVSRISHGLYWIALVFPGAIGLFHPGLGAYDEMLGLASLPAPHFWFAVGVILFFFGVILMVGSNHALVKKGRGAAAFVLTERLVTDGVYARSRNPMSLGFYAACLGLGLTADSLSVTLAIVLVLVPAHILNLRLFEERELALRYGAAYEEYCQRVPFLIPRLRRG